MKEGSYMKIKNILLMSLVFASLTSFAGPLQTDYNYQINDQTALNQMMLLKKITQILTNYMDVKVDLTENDVQYVIDHQDSRYPKLLTAQGLIKVAAKQTVSELESIMKTNINIVQTIGSMFTGKNAKDEEFIGEAIRNALKSSVLEDSKSKIYSPYILSMKLKTLQDAYNQQLKWVNKRDMFVVSMLTLTATAVVLGKPMYKQSTGTVKGKLVLTIQKIIANFKVAPWKMSLLWGSPIAVIDGLYYSLLYSSDYEFIKDEDLNLSIPSPVTQN